MNKSEIFKAAWKLAKQGVVWFGGSSKDYFSESLKISYRKEVKKMSGLNIYSKEVRNAKGFDPEKAHTLDKTESQNQIIEAIVPMFFRSEKKIELWINNMQRTMLISKDFPTAEKAQVLVEKINAVNDDKLFHPAFVRLNKKGKYIVTFGSRKTQVYY